MEESKRIKAEYRSSIRSKVMIREALLGLMLEKPFEKITITDIVRKADINRGTFYAHFKNTNEVLNSISVSIVSEIGSNLSEMDRLQLLTDPTPFLKCISSFLAKDREFYQKLLSTDKFSDVLENARYTAIGLVLEELKEEDEWTRNFVTTVLDYSISGITTLYIDIILGKVPVSLENSAEFLAQLLKPQVEALSNLSSRKTPEDHLPDRS